MKLIRTITLALTLVCADATHASDFAQLYRATLTAWQAEDWDTARSHMLEAAELRPDFPDVLRSLALIEARRGETGMAIAHLQRIADLGYSLSASHRLGASPVRMEGELALNNQAPDQGTAPFQTLARRHLRAPMPPDVFRPLCRPVRGSS